MKKGAKKIILAGIITLLYLLAAVWFSYTFNEGRLVKPIGGEYSFVPMDIPMIIALIAAMLYILMLVGWLVYCVIKNYKERYLSHRTRKLNPKLGLLGLLGFLGFAGIWTYTTDGMIFPFAFFSFFGFFGFFFEGKMSGTFMDERFKENAQRAQLTSLRTGFVIIWLTVLVLGRGHRFFDDLDHVAIAYTVVISIVIGFIIFFSEYLLYRYDHDAPGEE